MWNVSEPMVQTSTLDFTSSGQGRRTVSQLKTGDVVLMNALELMEWSTERTQLLICNECGIPGCSSGGWVNLRKTNDRVVLIPAFDDIERDDWSRDEYSPPKYLRKEGTPYFDLGTYESLVAKDLGFPTLNQIASLEMREAVRLAQCEMPFQILG